jgi:1-phosphofructokinase
MTEQDQAICVFATALFVAVTVERRGEGDDEIHIHPGGQGFWVARMVRRLGGRPILCAPLGGESGRVIQTLVPEWGIDLAAVEVSSGSPAYVHDRRRGERIVVAVETPPGLDRHEGDDLYAAVLDRALAAGVVVITGRVDEVFSTDFYRRLGSDLASNDVRVVGDLHGEELDAFLEGGVLDVLKVSDEDLHQDGRIGDLQQRSLPDAIAQLHDAGATAVVVSRGSDPVMASLDGSILLARPPELEEVDSRGSGDSMTAGLAMGVALGLGPEETLRLACAAGTANVARHGLGNASLDLITQLADRVELEGIET